MVKILITTIQVNFCAAWSWHKIHLNCHYCHYSLGCIFLYEIPSPTFVCFFVCNFVCFTVPIYYAYSNYLVQCCNSN